MKQKQIINAIEAAAILGCTERHARRLLQEFQIDPRGSSDWGIGRGRRVVLYARKDVEDFVKGRKTK